MFTLNELPSFSEPWNFSDVVLKVEEEHFHVHRAILAMNSPVFKTMFQSEFKESSMEEIPLPGKKADRVYDFLCMLYPFPIQMSENHDIKSLLEMAREYQVHKLTQSCEERLLQKQSSVDLILLAQEFSLKKLLEKCLNSLSRMHLQELKTHPKFEDIETDHLVSLLTNNIRWLKEQHNREIRQLKEQNIREKSQAVAKVNELNECWGYNKLPMRGCACASYTKSCDICNAVLEKYVKTKCGEIIEVLTSGSS
ncbi:BTB and MATH domain-containing protein 36-like [Actinia tenebrosa]|uniref:BTB and MATH domain-containing protein 36-like n=1 Tax=Actinia tenebrosa TaxID=6105 RepID=A0A6P8H5F2_ACTTE|nr:BTB and MATH domain-containing protein 36-like [Actinia tenebrosa]